MSETDMERELDVLVLEDVATDAEVVEHALRLGKIAFRARRVERRDEFERALQASAPDVILADYKLPAFDGLSALRLAKQQLPDTPFIVVTGALSDEDAAQLLREGASDYILKDRLARLAPAVRRAIDEGRVAAEKREADERYRTLFTESLDGIVLIEADTGKIIDCNPEFERQAGRPLDVLKHALVWDLGSPDQMDTLRAAIVDVSPRGTRRAPELVLSRPDGTRCPIDFRVKDIGLRGRRYIQLLCRDITDRKEEERVQQEQVDELRRFQRVAVDRELRMEELERELERLQGRHTEAG